MAVLGKSGDVHLCTEVDLQETYTYILNEERRGIGRRRVSFIRMGHWR